MTYQGCKGLEVCNDRAAEEGSGRSAAERYYAEYVRLPAVQGSVEAALQAAINEGGEAKLEADQHGQGTQRWRPLPGVGYVRVLLRVGSR